MRSSSSKLIASLAASTLTLALAGSSCGEAESPPEETMGPPVTVPDLDPEEVTASFDLSIDTDSEALAAATLEPKSGVVSVDGGTEELTLTALAKPVVKRPGIVWVELFLENHADTALRDVTVTLEDAGGAAQIYDFTNDPFADAAPPGSIVLGGLGARGVGRIAIGVDVGGGGPAKLSARVSGVRTLRQSSNSSPIAMTPDGSEAWAVVPDADTVSVIDASSDARMARIDVPGRPSSIAITPDGVFVLVASSEANTVTVIDRDSKQIVQTLGEADGIGREPRNLVVTPDGGRAFVSAYVGDTVTSLVRNADRYWVEKSIPVKRRPVGLSVSPDSKTVFVAHYFAFGTLLDNEGAISILDAEAGAVSGEITIGDTLNADRAHCLADVFGVSPIRVVTEGAPTQVAGLFLDPAGARGWAPHTRIAAGPIIEKGPNGATLDSALEPRPGESSAAFVLLADTRVPREAEEVLSMGNVERPVADSYLECERFAAEIEMTARTIIPGSPKEQVPRFPAFPTGIMGLTESGIMRAVGFTRGGRRALLLAHTSDEIAVFDGMTAHPTSTHHTQLSGSNPTGIAVTPDGAKAFVVYDNSTFASVLDLSSYADDDALPGVSYVPYEYRDVPEVPPVGGVVGSKQLVRDTSSVPELPELVETGTVPLVDADPMDPLMRRGRTLFYSSNPEKFPMMTKSRLGTCGSCHPDGGHDGTMWATMEGERRTMSLRGGVAGRGWLHAMGTHRDASEFAEIIVKERLGGDLSPEDADALAGWMAFGVPKLQHPRVDEALAAEGAKLFADHCSSCHQGEQHTSGNADPDHPLGGGFEAGPSLYDVGTFSEDSHVLVGPFFESLFPPVEAQLFRELRGDRALGEGDFVEETLDFRARPNRAASEFKAPSLVNVWDNVLFFHDGRYDQLEDVVAHFDELLQLGLDERQKTALVEYLRTL